jgi:MSHA biogenesis protein MshO
MRRLTQRGVTLIELVVTIAVGSVVVAFMALFIVTPISAYTAQTRRAQLTDDAESVLRFMGRDLRGALPNSVRVTSSGTVTALEFWATIDGARYRDGGLPGDPLSLDFTTADAAFSSTVPFTQLALPWTSASSYLVIYNVGVPGANVYEMANIVTPAATTISITQQPSSNQDLITLSPAFQFAYGSPGKRMYLVSGPVSYLCDTGAATVTRYSGYSVFSTQPTSAAALISAGASASKVSADLGSCQFAFTAGTAQRNALATLQLQLTQTGESVQLLHEVQLVNSP